MTYHEIAIDCFRYLGFKRLAEVNMLTLPEYRILMEAWQLSMIDKDFYIHWQSYLNFAAQAEKAVGKGKTKPVYDRFEKFFDYKKELDKVRKRKPKDKTERFKGIGQLLRKGENKDG